MASLLDSLFNSDSYGGQQGGLLDFLRTLQMQNSQYQPSAGFPAAAASFADRFNAMPGAPAAVAPSGRSFDAASFSPSTYAPDQAQPIAVGGYQMPRIGGADQFRSVAEPAQGQMDTDVSALRRQRQPQQQGLPPALGGPQGNGGFLDNLSAGFQSIGNGGSILGALSGNPTDDRSIAQRNLKAEYDALVPVLGPQNAMLAVMNKDAGKVLLSEALSDKQDYGVISENPIEGKKYGFIDKRSHTVNGQPVGSANVSGAAGGPGLLAPGVSQYNPNLSGNEYLGQFSPEVQAAAKAYLNGDVLPSGNPRQQGIASQAKTIAQKYAADMGIPVSDALYAEKRKYRTELGTNSPNSAGGQVKAFNQGISHMSVLADTLEKLDNSNGLGIPFVAQGVNAVRQGASNAQAAVADEAKAVGQSVAGEVGKLFSGSAGGGVHERELTRSRFDTVKSKPQLAAALRATVELMQGGLAALEQNRDRILGPNSGVDFVGDETRQKIAKIQGVIDRLEGKAGGNVGPSKSGLPSGWSVQVR